MFYLNHVFKTLMLLHLSTFSNLYNAPTVSWNCLPLLPYLWWLCSLCSLQAFSFVLLLTFTEAGQIIFLFTFFYATLLIETSCSSYCVRSRIHLASFLERTHQIHFADCSHLWDPQSLFLSYFHQYENHQLSLLDKSYSSLFVWYFSNDHYLFQVFPFSLWIIILWFLCMWTFVFICLL